MALKKSFKYNITLFIVFLSIIWSPLQRLWIEIDGASRLIFTLCLIGVFINMEEIVELCFRRPVPYYLVLTFYMFVNGLVFDSAPQFGNGSMGYFIMIVHIFLAPMLMLLTVSLIHYNVNRTLSALLLAVLIYVVISVVTGTGNIYDEQFESVVANGNSIALMVFTGFMLAIIQLARKRIGIPVFIVIEAVFIYAIMKVGSRMGFGMMFIVAIVSVLTLRRQRNLRTYVFLAVLVVAGYFVVDFIMDETFLGERLMNTTTQMEDSRFATGTVFDRFGDRGIQYYLSWPFFVKHPFFGIGFHQWINYSPSKLVSHSEYMVQYLEGGAVAFFLYMPFFIGLVVRLVKGIRINPGHPETKTAKVLFAAMLAVIFGNFVLWTYDSKGVFIIYGIAHAITLKLLEGKCTTLNPLA